VGNPDIFIWGYAGWSETEQGNIILCAGCGGKLPLNPNTWKVIRREDLHEYEKKGAKCYQCHEWVVYPVTQEVDDRLTVFKEFVQTLDMRGL